MADTAIVTGGNRGIGLEVCRELASKGVRVILAARDEKKAREAASKVGAEPATLDVSDDASVRRFAEWLGDRTIHALVNNAGMSMKGFDAHVAKTTIDTNYFGALRVTEAVLPNIARGGRIVMVSSGMGRVACLASGLQKRFAETKTKDDVSALMREFVDAVARGVHEREGWPSSAYSVSKVGMNALARALARELSPRGILVNAVDPGWVRTDMGGPSAPRGVEEGADTIVWAATLGPDGPNGVFLRDRKPQGW